MPFSAASPRAPFVDAAPLAHRPLSAIAAACAGGVPQARIQRIIAELVPVLDDLHQNGRICGDISVHSVGMDEAGRAHLMALSGVSRPGGTALPLGYAPFELYTEAPEWPRGPWTDIYALSAVAYSLITGQRPPEAPERRVSDTYLPLTARGLTKYDARFLAAIDAGLAMMPSARPQTTRAFADLLAVPSALRAPRAGPVEARQTVEPAVSAETARAPRQGGFLPLMKAALLSVATLAVSAYWWDRLTEEPEEVITYSESAVPHAPAPDVAIAPAPPPASSPPSVQSATLMAAPLAQWQASRPLAEHAQAVPSVLPARPVSDDESAGKVTAMMPSPPPPPLSPVRVTINVQPWGEILVNGVSRGVTPPLKTLRLAPGRYSVTVRNPAQPPYRMILAVKAGKPALIEHTFR